MKTVSLFLVFFLFNAWSDARDVKPEEIQHLQIVKQLLGDIQTQPLQDMIRELQRSRHPMVDLQMKEAIARAYTDIVKEENVDGKQKREWLYSMVCLNMAYLQFAGRGGIREITTELNKLIRRKLAFYLPAAIYTQPGFFYSLK